MRRAPETLDGSVVSGVLVDADHDWKRLEEHLVGMADRLAPPEARDGFVFHATEIFSGGRRFPKDRFPPEKRWTILDELVAVPRMFELPIAMGVTRRDTPYETIDAGITSEERMEACLQVAFLMCMSQVERVMRQFAPGESALVIMEASKPKMHTAYIQFQKFLRDKERVSRVPGHDEEKHFLPLRQIIENPTFSLKSDSNPLQVADACAFAIKRHMTREYQSARFYEPLTAQMIMRPVGDDPPVAERLS